MRYRVLLLVGALLPAVVVAQQGDPQLPRFRAGANLVRVDAYVSKDDAAITGLTVEDFVVYEDDRPQQVESFEAITAREARNLSDKPEASSVAEMRQQATDSSRLFTLFFDRMHVSLSGSYRAQKPIIDTLDQIIGPDDMVGVMTPEMSSSAITYSRRTSSIERFVTDSWTWGARDQANVKTDQERLIESCYTTRDSAGMAQEMIARLREQQSLDALRNLVVHLEGLRPERKFVLVFTEGWPLYKVNDSLARVADGRVPSLDAPGVDPRTGGLRRTGDPDPATGMTNTQESCDRLRTMLAYIDHEVEFRELLQRANRANVSFYPIDARGLIVFDTPIQWGVPPSVDQAWLNKRQDDLRMMAQLTDGQVVLNTNDVGSTMKKIFADIGSYYLLSYYSSNPKLDGRFRRIRVEVKREGATVRHRLGYLAPTESEARAGGVTIDRPGAKPSPPPTVTRALDAIAPARGNLPARVQAIGGRNTIRAIVELDQATAKLPEWISGGTLKLYIEPERTMAVGMPTSTPAAPTQTITVQIEPGQRSIVIPGSDQPLAPGRYMVRAELASRNSRTPLQVTTFVTVPADSAEVGSGALASRRGPSTGLAYIATADPRFRRTERLRIEVPLAGEGFKGTGRLLTRAGQATPLVVNFTTRVDDVTKQQLGVAEVVLAPLAEGEYVLELSLEKNGKAEQVAYGFRIIV